MIFGIGTDIVNVGRIRHAVDRWGEHFLKRIFTQNEIAYCYGMRSPYASLAVRFAAKEAFIKAIGAEITVPLREIEVVRSEKGRPLLNLHGRSRTFVEERRIEKIHLSLSHEAEFGVAFVIMEKD